MSQAFVLEPRCDQPARLLSNFELHRPARLSLKDEPHLDEIEQDQGKLRRALKHVTRLLQDAERLIEKQRR